MSESKPLVSAVVTTHNRADLLPRALDSVAEQTYPNIEIIIVDDGSTDHTPEVVKEYKNHMPVKYIRLENSQGASAARNKGIMEAGGDFVAGLDDDDKWHEDRIADLYAAYSDEFSCVTSDVFMIYSNGEATWRKQKIIDLETLFFTNQVGNQVLVQRQRVLDVGGFDPTLDAAQDYDLWIRLCKAFGPIRNVQKPLQTVYMDHQEERITDKSSFKGYLQFYNKHKRSFNQAQRKYQLYNIRRAQGKPLHAREFLFNVPSYRYWKELKRIIANKMWQ